MKAKKTKMVRRIYKQAVIVLIPLTGLTAISGSWRLPLGVVAGGLLALLNLEGLSWGLQGVGSGQAGLLVIFSLFRLLLLFAALAALAWAGLVNLLGVLLGMTVVFFLLMKEGLMVSREMDMEDGEGTGDEE